MENLFKSNIKERLQQYGTSGLLDEEALSYLTGIPIAETKGAITNYGLLELVKFSDNMTLTSTQKKKLKLLYNFSKRLAIATFKEKPVLDSSSKAGEYFVNKLQFYSNEVFVIGLLDSQNRLILCKKVSEGTVNEAHIYAREIVKIALNHNAVSTIFSHSHPGGSLKPSSADIEVTKKLVKALDAVSIKVIDHIIVADGNFVSFAEKGLMPCA
jgi:DNA repair protein RadC